MFKRALMALAPLSLFTVACSPAEEARIDAPAEYAVVDGWVRNPPGGRDVTAGFITLTAGAPGGQLVAAETAEAEHVEIHTMVMEGDVMRMRRIEAIDIPAGGAAILAPGADHLMIFGVNAEDMADGEMDITLTFADGETLPITLPILDTAPDLDMGHGEHGEGHNH